MTLDELLSQSRLDSLDQVVQVQLPDGTQQDIKQVVYVEGKVIIHLESNSEPANKRA